MPPLMMATERELLDRCRGGEEAALAEFYEQHKRRVFRVTARIVGALDAEDVTQDVFVRALRSLANFRGDAQIATWLYRMAVNTSLTHISRRRPHMAGSEDDLAKLAAEPARRSDERVADALARAMATLPAGYRAILTLHDIEELTHEECAEILGCSIGTCKSQLHKARSKMRELLGDDFAEESR